MKKIFTLLIYLVLISNLVNGQSSDDILRCATSDYYVYITPDYTKKINKACSICYTGGYCSFYIPELGMRSFKVAQPTGRRVAEDGIVTISIFNEEDATEMRGDIMVDIEYGATMKTILISYTRFGDAYLIKSKGFIGSMENGNSQSSIVKKTIEKIKETESDSILKKQKDADKIRADSIKADMQAKDMLLKIKNDSLAIVKEIQRRDNTIDSPASFPGGEHELFLFTYKNLKLPKSKKNPYGATVYVKCIIDENGNIKDAHIDGEDSVEDSYNKEALRLIAIMPKWIPAKTLSGKSISSYTKIQMQLIK